MSWDDAAGVSSDNCETLVAVESGGLGHTSPPCLLSSVECGVCWEELASPQSSPVGVELSCGGYPLQIKGPSWVTLGLLVVVCVQI